MQPDLRLRYLCLLLALRLADYARRACLRAFERGIAPLESLHAAEARYQSIRAQLLKRGGHANA